MSSSGTPRKVVVAGVPFDVMADCNPSSNFSEWKTESLPTSGQPVHKMTRQNCYIKNLDLKCSVSEFSVLTAFAETAVSIPLILIYAGGNSATGLGKISLGDHEGQNNKVTVEFMFDFKPVVI